MRKVEIKLDASARRGCVDERLYGAFVEHMGRCVYTGLYEPGHPQADENGFRQDVVRLVRGLGVPIIRYPGGNFVSCYRWEDGVGPKAERPRRLELAWRSLETNQVGINEFAAWCRQLGAQPLMAVNLGTRGIQAACDLLEYCNHPGGTALSDLRISHGVPRPHAIKTWCLGNEMDGPWQLGHKTATEYGRLACETARAMRRIDPSIELVACGSSGPAMPSFPAWEAEVLAHTYDQVDYISLHQYIINENGDAADYLAQSMGVDRYIRTVLSVCDAAAAKAGSSKMLGLSFDEWNVAYPHYTKHDELMEKHPWGEAMPLLEEPYSMLDALVVGCLLITLLNHSDRVKIGCIAQLINVLASVMTVPGKGAWRQSIYYPLMHASRFGRGVALVPQVACDKYDSLQFTDVPMVEMAAVLDEETGDATLFAVNRNLEDEILLDAELQGFGNLEQAEHITMHHRDIHAANGPDAEHCRPVHGGSARMEKGRFSFVLPPASWNVIRVKKTTDTDK